MLPESRRALTAHGLTFVRPTANDRNELNRIIMDELVRGVFTPEAIAFSPTMRNRPISPVARVCVPPQSSSE